MRVVESDAEVDRDELVAAFAEVQAALDRLKSLFGIGAAEVR